jgi:hypothetical protein
MRLPDGSTLRLEAARLGGRWLTSRAAVWRFLAAQTPDLSAGEPPTTRAAKTRSAEQATAATLDAARL